VGVLAPSASHITQEYAANCKLEACLGVSCSIGFSSGPHQLWLAQLCSSPMACAGTMIVMASSQLAVRQGLLWILSMGLWAA
jgi:hypothetical protein